MTQTCTLSSGKHGRLGRMSYHCYKPFLSPDATLQQISPVFLNKTCISFVTQALLWLHPKSPPKSMPRLELCGALAGAQLAQLLQRELTLNLQHLTLWTDSTTVLERLQSESCRFKVFVGTRVAEIQELTNPNSWRYVDSVNNPADDVTRAKTLVELSTHGRWSHNGPHFLQQPPDTWPVRPNSSAQQDLTEFRNLTFCGLTVKHQTYLPDPAQHTCWKDLVEAT